MEFIGPAALVLIGNLFSGSPGSKRWEIVTAFYGWFSALTIVGYFTGLLAITYTSVFGEDVDIETFSRFVIPLSGFALMQALTRDYEKILKPLFDKWLDKGE